MKVDTAPAGRPVALLRIAALSGLLWTGATARVAAGPTGLNTIPTTDIVPYQSWILSLQNSNTAFTTPAFFSAPDVIYQSQFAITPRVEAGVDYFQPPDALHPELVGNVKQLFLTEDYRRPNLAAGIWNISSHQKAGYYVTLSKTLNFAQEQYERFRAHHRRNRKLLGRRIHIGLSVDGHGSAVPFVGTDLQLNDSSVFQADWISGAGNAITAGVAYVLPDQRTVVAPVLQFSNNQHRIDGFFINISHQFNL